jgi:hypothetical protein
MLLTALSVALLLALDQPVPSTEQLTAAFDNLKAAEAKKDSSAIIKWATETSKLARVVINASASGDAEDAADLKSRLDFAKQINTYSDYALYAGALQVADPATRIQFFEALEQQSPKSEYVSKLYAVYIAALTQTGKQAKLFPFAEKAIANDPSNEELLAILADGAMTRKQWDRAATYGARLASVLANHPKPEGYSAADWERRKVALQARGYWIAGIAFSNQNKHSLADTNLRAALPLVKGDPQMLAATLFYLGVSDYGLARATHNRVMMQQALDFSQQAANMASPYQQLAAQNAWAIKGELTRWR